MNLPFLNRKLTLLLIFTFLVTGIILPLPTPEFPGHRAAFAQSVKSEAGINDIFNTIQLMREEYIKSVDPYLLLEGAGNGMREYLKEKNLNLSPLNESFIDKTRTVEANLRAFGIAYGKVLMFNGDKLNENDLVYSALNGMMSSLRKEYDDPYTVSLTAKEYSNMQEQLNSQSFSGIGIFMELDKNAEVPVIVETVEGSPAHRAGLRSGDHILKLDGNVIKGMDMDAISSRIRGPVNTGVTLTIRRKQKKLFNVRVFREVVKMRSVSSKMIENLGYIKIRYFGDTTREELKNALLELDGKNARGYILDLRNNGGGYIIAADDVCSFFIKEGTTITSVVNYRTGSRDVHRASPTIRRNSLPLVILVNGFSASAAEITAGCFQDHKQAVIIGEQTFGKGSVQTIHRLPGGGAVKYTTAHYLTPSGKDINKTGITPDILLKMDPSLIGSDSDTQLRRAVGVLKTKVRGD